MINIRTTIVVVTNPLQNNMTSDPIPKNNQACENTIDMYFPKVLFATCTIFQCIMCIAIWIGVMLRGPLHTGSDDMQRVNRWPPITACSHFDCPPAPVFLTPSNGNARITSEWWKFTDAIRTRDGPQATDASSTPCVLIEFEWTTSRLP